MVYFLLICDNPDRAPIADQNVLQTEFWTHASGVNILMVYVEFILCFLSGSRVFIFIFDRVAYKLRNSVTSQYCELCM